MLKLKKMEVFKKKVTYKMYPNKTQEAKLWGIFILLKYLYNALLEQRIDAYKRCGVSLSYYDQSRELPKLKAQHPEYKVLNAQSMQNMTKRIDRSFKNFFRRVKLGQAPGFPRFKSNQTFPGWGYNTHGDGWKIINTETGHKKTKNKRSGKVRISGVGIVSVRGMARDKNGTPKVAEITKRNGKWFISVTYEVAVTRRSGDKVTAFDLGVKELASISEYSDKENTLDFKSVKKLDELTALQKELKKTQRQLSRKKKGSKRRDKLKKILQNKHSKIKNKRHDTLHKESAKLVSRSKVIGTEKLQLKNMLRSAKGTMEKPGKNVKQKSGLNRNMSNHGLGALVAMIEYKAKEAGVHFELLNTRKLKPTQRCSGCYEVTKKTLSDRVHKCKHCGLKLDRDRNASLVMLKETLKIHGLGQAVRGVEALVFAMKRETPAIAS